MKRDSLRDRLVLVQRDIEWGRLHLVSRGAHVDGCVPPFGREFCGSKRLTALSLTFAPSYVVDAVALD